ncbi:MAG: hypothetical protein ACOYM3_18560 [Terrimicrobiaceae bacterium]
MRGKSDFLLLFQNTAVTDNLFTFAPQFRLAEDSGIKRFVFQLSGIPWNADASSWEAVDRGFARYWEGNSNVQVAPRLLFEPYLKFADWCKAGAVVNSKGELTGQVSASSPEFLVHTKAALRSLVRHMETGRNAERVWAYYLACLETGEWIPWNYRQQGADYSVVSRNGFREWLGKHYGSDEAFAAAWGKPGARRDAAGIPVDSDARFPMHPLPRDQSIMSFYSLPEDQDWVDYSEYVSDLNVRWIRELSEVVRQESSKPIITFYGYIFELPGSMCGHLKARELLKEDTVQFLGGPISYWPYAERLTGGVGGPMTAVDSLALDGVTYITEDDTKTHVSMPGIKTPAWYWDGNDSGHRAMKNAEETGNLHRRNLAFTAFHGTATWWMDLIGAGWFSDQSTWDLWTGEFGKALRSIRALPYRPTLAVIADEESRLYEKWSYSGFEETYPVLRNAAMACGAPVGFYYLDDFLEGRVPECEAYLFVNVWRLSSERLDKLKARLSKEKATVIWQYAPGYLNPAEGGIPGVKATTGFDVAVDEGRLGSKGVGECAGMSFGGKNPIKPRILIPDEAAEPLARYATGEVSAAVKTVNGCRNIFVADIGWTSDLIHRLMGNLASTDHPAVVQCSDRLLYVYAVRDGVLRIKAPAGKTFKDGGVVTTVDLARGESRLLELNPL